MRRRTFLAGLLALFGLGVPAMPAAEAAPIRLAFSPGSGITGFLDVGTTSLSPLGDGSTSEFTDWAIKLGPGLALWTPGAGGCPLVSGEFACLSGTFEFENFLPVSWNFLTERIGFGYDLHINVEGDRSATTASAVYFDLNGRTSTGASIDGCAWASGCAPVAAVPLPAALPLTTAALGFMAALGLWRRSKPPQPASRG